jgi:hypothetical protein
LLHLHKNAISVYFKKTTTPATRMNNYELYARKINKNFGARLAGLAIAVASSSADP